MRITVTNKLGKADATELAKRLAQPVFDGNEGALQQYLRLKHIESAVKQAMAFVYDEAFSEVDGYKGETLLGATVSVSRRAQYDFAKDTAWLEIGGRLAKFKGTMNALNTERKAREAVLRNISEPVVDPKTGEFVYPAEYLGDKSNIVVRFG